MRLGRAVTEDAGLPDLPGVISTEEELDELLTRPTPALVESVRRIDGDVMLLGVGGKMGPTLALMLRRAMAEAGVKARVIGASLFSSEKVREQLEREGVETISCDLLDSRQLASVPVAPNVIYLVGMKFGSVGNEPLTWAINACLPGMVAQHFAGSRIVALSTGNVYPLAPVMSGGSREGDPVGPVGEYAQSCLGRERIFTYWTERTGNPLTLIRLNYAVELRYGVLMDIAQNVYHRQPVDLTTGYFNCVWQGDANSTIIRSLEYADCPACVLNLTGAETLSVRRVARQFGEIFGVEPQFTGEEAPTALLSNAGRCVERFGCPTVSVDRLIAWTAHWVKIGGATLSKPTHFQTRDGKF